ncbi:MAG: PSP1 domain-containing protein [Cetobacterium sp.]
MTQGNLELDRNIDIDEATLSKADASEETVQEEIVADPNKLYNILGVMFETTKKRYSFEIIDNLDYKKGDKVIVDTVRGKEIGIVYGGPMQLPERVLVLPLKPVVKKAEAEEIKKYEALRLEGKEAYRVCKERISHHKLPMKLIEAEFTFDKTKLIFYFTAEGRIDFRELVKDLANIFKLRIELRQIGVRDEARILGNIGVCGKELCCRTFINKFDSVSIKMARDQGLVINPAKISGVCGRLLCCINYEYKQYEEALKVYPAVNQIVKTTKGDGKVLSISPLNGFLYIDIEGKGIMKILIEEIKFNKKEAKKLQNVLSNEEMKHKSLEKE